MWFVIFVGGRPTGGGGARVGRVHQKKTYFVCWVRAQRAAPENFILFFHGWVAGGYTPRWL